MQTLSHRHWGVRDSTGVLALTYQAHLRPPHHTHYTLTAHAALPKEAKSPEATGETAPAPPLRESPKGWAGISQKAKPLGEKSPGRTQQRGPDVTRFWARRTGGGGGEPGFSLGGGVQTA